MNVSRFPQITDELLSAYIDNAVTAEERHLIAQAAQQDPTIAWRLESLQQTVKLLRALPPLPLPRSFVLTEADLAQADLDQTHSSPIPKPAQIPAANRSKTKRVANTPAPGFWGLLKEFWQGGNPFLRNLAAVCATAWLVLFGVNQLGMDKLLPIQANNPNRTVFYSSTTANQTGVTEQAAAQQPQAAVEAAQPQPLLEVGKASASSEENTAAQLPESSQAIAQAPAEPDAENGVANNQVAVPTAQTELAAPVAQSAAPLAVAASGESEAASAAAKGMPSSDAAMRSVAPAQAGAGDPLGTLGGGDQIAGDVSAMAAGGDFSTSLQAPIEVAASGMGGGMEQAQAPSEQGDGMVGAASVPSEGTTIAGVNGPETTVTESVVTETESVTAASAEQLPAPEAAPASNAQSLPVEENNPATQPTPTLAPIVDAAAAQPVMQAEVAAPASQPILEPSATPVPTNTPESVTNADASSPETPTSLSMLPLAETQGAVAPPVTTDTTTDTTTDLQATSPNPAQSSVAVEQVAQPQTASTSSPDSPIRSQLVQLGLAIFTALFAGLWLFSHNLRKSL